MHAVEKPIVTTHCSMHVEKQFLLFVDQYPPEFLQQLYPQSIAMAWKNHCDQLMVF
jgi:hypothetical protein